ncbi:dihydroorotate dehydrogenase-like protein [Kiritimatiella glycovorans]|uniref:Dihydroorotate dehydrogenase B (NAD(+)), catalytic subunit n=1 Tax=Kiritimatiella glycovorans TaxID=1307763 RepID=A0A0G3EBE6_9BACT|nr:dihydroorotate dehydrogenase-like protein [Kiritimatiella glycovorans]AKJ63618.1 Dihydroorotate dehydrogenase B (NAD(+)), catalytic subunit [Kiritimatiella glycovorans]
MNTTTTYLGMELKNPLVPSAGPFSQNIDGIRRLEDAGAAAVVMFSLFEEQLRHEADALDYLTSAGSESFPEALSYFPEVSDYRVGADEYLDTLREAKEKTDIPIIGSLNGISSEGWIDYSKKMEQAGADAIELNVYYLGADMEQTAEQVEALYEEAVRSVRAAVDVPVAVKLSPYFSSTAHACRKMVNAGADGLVLFNRFYQPDLDIENREVDLSLNLSSPHEMRLPLRWIGLLRGRIGASLGATTGVHTAEDAVKYLMAGADAVMMTSVLLEKGLDHLGVLLGNLTKWMEAHEYESVEQMQGCLSHKATGGDTAFERANYIKILESYKGQYLTTQQ